MTTSQITASAGQLLTHEQITDALDQGLDGNFRDLKILVLIPDHTRSLPLPFLFRSLVDVLYEAKQLDFMVALGTHPPLSEESLNKLVGISIKERMTTFKHVGLLNHAWSAPAALTSL